MVEVEWYVSNGLGDGNDVLSECVRDACLVHDVRVLSREIDDDDLGAEDQIEDVLDDDALFPDVVNT